ncbi:hypothetical protein [Nitrosomonas aestuarii]|nr:hypothetical protein [Nitrosomonas aestuarii]
MTNLISQKQKQVIPTELVSAEKQAAKEKKSNAQVSNDFSSSRPE